MTARSLIAGSGVLLGALLLIGCASDSQQPTTQSVGACVHRAKKALRDADFDQHGGMTPSPDGTTVFGNHASYRAELTCSAADKLVHFHITGPDGDQADWYRDTIIRKF